MKLRVKSPHWFDDENPANEARCVKFPATAEYDPWYPKDSDTTDHSVLESDTNDLYTEAKNICHGTYYGSPCPLLEACLNFALVNNERYGVWGGTTPEERIQLRKEMRQSLKSEQAGDQSPAENY